MTPSREQLARRVGSCIGVPAPEVADLVRILIESEPTAEYARKTRDLLDMTGLGQGWNSALDRGRASYLAHRVRACLPGRRPRVLDLLSGTGTVAEALRATGCDVWEIERLAHFPGRARGRWVRDLDDGFDDLTVDAVLIAASLHHDSDLDATVGALSRARASRFVVVENPLTDDTNADLHRRFDWFFNSCLNEFGAESPGWYWTTEQWMVYLSTLGVPRFLGRHDDVPGIPFPYDFFEVLPRPGHR